MNKTNIKLNHFFFCLITKAISEKKKLKIVLCQRCTWSWFLCAEGEKKTGRQKSKVVIWIIFLHDMSVSHLILYLCGIKKKKKRPTKQKRNNEPTWDLNHKWIQGFLQKLPVYILGKAIVQDVSSSSLLWLISYTSAKWFR